MPNAEVEGKSLESFKSHGSYYIIQPIRTNRFYTLPLALVSTLRKLFYCAQLLYYVTFYKEQIRWTDCVKNKGLRSQGEK